MSQNFASLMTGRLVAWASVSLVCVQNVVRYDKKKQHIHIRKCMKVYDKHFLHVSTIHVTIFKEEHYKLSIHRNIT